VLDCYPKLVAIDEEANHQIVHGRRFRKAHGTTHETLDPGPQIEVCTLDFLRMLLANVMLRWVDMPLVGAPSIRVKPRHTKRFSKVFPLQEDRILPPPEDVRQHGAPVVLDGMSHPPRLRFLADLTPPRIELGRQPATLLQLLGTADLDLHVLGVQILQHRLIHLLEVRFFFFSSFMTVVGLTCNTRAVSRIPLAFIAMSTIWRFTSGD